MTCRDHETLAEKTLTPGVCVVFFLGFPLSLHVFRGFFGPLGVGFALGVRFVLTGRAVGDSKWTNGMCDGEGLMTRSGSLFCAGGGTSGVGLAEWVGEG